MSEYHAPSLRELAAAHKEFEANEPRDLFYRAATELIELAIRGQTSSLSLVEAVAILLQTWNASYYRFHGKFDSQDFAQLEKAVRHDESLLMKFRDRTIADFTGRDEKTVRRIFARFEQALGPVGAAKCLHLLAPTFFPLWDRAIARAYGVALLPVKSGGNASQYAQFALITQQQCRELEGSLPTGRNPLKALDEYNYIHFTKQARRRNKGRS